MTHLQTLCLNSNNFSSTLPESLTQLTQLNLDNNQLSGSLPESWSAMDQVKFMSLRLNSISGPLPQKWTVMATNALRNLWLRGNALTGVVPPSWGHVVGLSVSGNFSIDNNLKDIPVNYHSNDDDHYDEDESDCPGDFD